MSETTEPLTEAHVAEIIEVFPHAEYQPTLSPDEVSPCEPCKGAIDDHKAGCVVPLIHALIRDWRAMKAENERLNRLIAEATVTAPWRAGYTDYVPTAGDPVRSVADLIAHIKERGGRVSELESSVTFWQVEALLGHFCSEHAKKTRQAGHYCTICAKPFVMSVPQGERPPKYKDLVDENAALRERLVALVNVWRHADSCEWWLPRKVCTCGLADIVEKIK